MSLTIDKSMEGQVIYAIGRENAKPRIGENPLYQVEIVTVAKTKAVVKFLSTGQTKKLSTNGCGDHSFNYSFYRNVQDFQAAHFRVKIVDALLYQHESVSSEVMVKIGELLGLDMDVSHLIKGPKGE
ncbi:MULTISPECIES: hypothetical protein [Aeromonas]|uniref:hypothetical protein n=1 Tax=Aeromonas TaxID=642 RepID=UPI002B0590E3|nr:hypothetical protein [Aeromonas jandaei]